MTQAQILEEIKKEIYRARKMQHDGFNYNKPHLTGMGNALLDKKVAEKRQLEREMGIL